MALFRFLLAGVAGVLFTSAVDAEPPRPILRDFLGICGHTIQFQPKPAYHALAHLQSTLGNYRFAGVLTQKPGEVYAFEFAQADAPTNRVIVAWSPTGSGRRATAALTLPPNTRIVRAQRMPLAKGVPLDVTIPSPAEVPSEESPLYLLLGPDR